MPTCVIERELTTVRLERKHLIMERGKARRRVPLNDIDRVLIVGRPNISIPVLQKFMRLGIPAFFVTTRGRWVGAITPDNNMNAGRRIRQYQLACDPEFRLKVATQLVKAKIRNSRRVLQRLAANRTMSQNPAYKEVVDELAALNAKVEFARSTDVLRGYEGLASAKYFSALGWFFPKNIPFTERNRRPPKDAANALLSWTYTILMGEIDGCVRAHGLDSCIGVLHEVSHGTPSLSLDLIEPLRAPICDLMVLNILNHRQMTEDSFEFHSEDGGVYLKQEVHKDFFHTYETAMTRKFTLRADEPHVDFRTVIKESVWSILKAMDGKFNEMKFFRMP